MDLQPELPNERTIRKMTKRYGVGPLLLVAAVALFVVTRIIVWLPLGFIGTFINGFLWPVLLLCLVAGAFLTWRRSQKAS